MLHFGLFFFFFFFFLVFSYLCGLDLSDYVWGFKNNSFTLVVASQSLLGR